MSNILTIAKRELRGYFSSPVAFVFIVIFLLLAGFFTFMIGGLFERGEAVFGVPLAVVDEVIQVSQLATLSGRLSLTVRGRPLPALG